jgi:hypothetical protein
MLSVMYQGEYSRDHGGITDMVTLRTGAAPTLRERPIQSSTGRTVLAVALPMQYLGNIACRAIGSIIKLTEKRAQAEGAPSLGERLIRFHFTGLTGNAIDGSHIEGALRLHNGYALLIGV